MKKNILSFLIISLFKVIFSFAQEITITGIIYDKTGIVSHANIINTVSKNGSFSNDAGAFSIKTKLGEQLEFTSIQHHKKIIIITEQILKLKILEVELELKDYLLNEVEIKKTSLTGILTIDTKFAKETKREEVMKRLGFNPYFKKKSAIDRQLHTASSSSGFLPLGLFINALSGRLKLLKKQKELAENEKKMDYIKRKYNRHLIQNLKIDSLNINRFIYFLHLDKDFKQKFSEKELIFIPFLKKQAIIFKKDSL